MIGALYLVVALLSDQSGTDVAQSALVRLRSKVAVEAVQGTLETLAGRYTNPSQELMDSWGGGTLSGEDLYLFPDGTYLYCEFADVEPLTVHDKGRWKLSGALIELLSDAEVTWGPRAERRYVIVRRSSRASEVLLIGLQRELPNFEAGASDGPESMLLVVALARAERYDANAAVKAKAWLMKNAWRPGWFSQRK
jgi:hypothetical protein